jgi:hypothetical protein
MAVARFAEPLRGAPYATKQSQVTPQDQVTAIVATGNTPVAKAYRRDAPRYNLTFG